jgi:hypothetical protein
MRRDYYLGAAGPAPAEWQNLQKEWQNLQKEFQNLQKLQFWAFLLARMGEIL